MKNKSLYTLAAAFIIFLAAAIAIPSVIIYNTPSEITSITAGNYLANLMNGGNVLEDNGFLFFANPKTRTLTRTETADGSKTKVLVTDCDGFLQVVGNSYYYVSGNELKCCDYDAKKVETIVENAENPLVVGGSVYYINKISGNLCKYSIRYKKIYTLDVKPKGKISFYSSRIYYIADDDTIRCVKSDGSDDKQFINEKAVMLEIDGKYMFYRNTSGMVKAMMLTSDSSVTSDIVKADNFAVQGQYIMFNSENKLFLANVNSLANGEKGYKPQKLLDTAASCISVDGKYYYFFDNNTLSRIPYDYTSGSFETVIKQ